MGIGIILKITSNTQDVFISDYIAPNNYKVYNAFTNPSASNIEGKTHLVVHWSTYSGGPSGDCPGSFDLSKNMNVMVNPTYQSCEFKALP